MKTKGFTLVELLAVIAILGVLLAVSVPVYIGISDAINQRLQETKLAELKAKSAEYSEEIGKNVFDVKSLIESGKLSPDSELDDYKDPMTGRDMSCDVITVTYEGASYEVNITESDECYEEQYLENLYGMIEFYLVDENEREITRVNENTWLRNQRVYVRYRLKEEYQGVGEIKEANWTGLQPVHCNTSDINSDQCQKYLVETYENGVRNVRVQLNVKLLLRNGVELNNQITTKVLLDLQRPTIVGSPNLNNDINTSGKRRVTFELSDGLGSGVSGYAFTKDITTPNSCSQVEYKEATDGIHVDYMTSGTYGICVKDQVGNITNDEELQSSQFEVKEVDISPPTIRFTIRPTNGTNDWMKALTIQVNTEDNEGVRSAKYCIDTNICIPNIDATLTSGITTRGFEVKIPDRANAQVLCVQVTDLAGNMSEVKCSAPYKVDGELPSQSFAIGESTKGSGEWYQKLKINVTGFDQHSGIINGRYCVTTGSICNPSSSFTGSFATVPIGNGSSPQTVCANFTDNAGNTSATTCMGSYYKVDGVSPTSNVSVNVGASIGGNNGWYKSLNISVGGSDLESGVASGKYCKGVNNCNPTTSFTGANTNTSLGNSASAQYVCATVTDNAGNTSSKSCGGPYYVDRVSPTGMTASNTVSGSTMTVYASASDSYSGVQRYYYRIKNGTWVSGGNSYTFYNVSSGNYSVEVYAMDYAGNASSIVTTSYTECQSGNQVERDTTDWSSCPKDCGECRQTQHYNYRDKNSNTICKQNLERSKTIQLKACDPIDDMDPNNYESSKKILCSEDDFSRLLDKYLSKFQIGLDYQAFRNALYDCADTTAKVMNDQERKSKIYNIFNNHSRTQTTIGYGKSTKSCSYTCPYDGECRGDTALSCIDEPMLDKLGQVYNGRVLVISASAEGSACHDSSKITFKEYDENECWIGCKYIPDAYTIAQEGTIVVRGLQTSSSYYTMKTKCNYGTWQDGNWDKRFNFFDSLYVGKFWSYDKWPNEGYKGSDEMRRNWSNVGVAVRYFII